MAVAGLWYRSPSIRELSASCLVCGGGTSNSDYIEHPGNVFTTRSGMLWLKKTNDKKEKQNKLLEFRRPSTTLGGTPHW